MSLLSRRNSLVGLALVVSLHVVLAQQAQKADDLGAKALFYNASGAIVSVPSAAPAAESRARPSGSGAAQTAQVRPAQAPAVLALRASVLLVAADGGTREVRPSHQFRSGDRLKLAFTSNRAGYFYLVTAGSSGKVQLLAPRRGEPAILESGLRYQFPAAQTAFFKFDHQVGREELWAVLSDEPLSAIDLGGGRIAQVPSLEGTQVATKAVASATEDMTTRDLVFEEDAEAAYASVRPSSLQRSDNAKKPRVMVKLVLDHR